VRRAGHKEIVAVEGLFDVILLQARGETRAVATTNTKLTTDQIETLAKHGIERVFICGDPDEAGDKGTVKSIADLAQREIRRYRE
jgi:putative DNA primase/helicase